MAFDGVIAERTRAILPITWDALLGDSRYGEELIQTSLDVAKQSVTGEVVATGSEVTTYPLFVVDYIAMIAALKMIPPGIDFWMNQPVSESATGENENHTFVDRAEALRKLAEMLLKATRELADEISAFLGYRLRSGKAVPLLNTIDDPFITPSPQEFPRPYAETAFS